MRQKGLLWRLIFEAMHRYLIKIPWWIKRFFASYVWSLPAKENAVYLTFDDGPHPTITPWVLDQLKQYGALATFFCIGKNVASHPDVYQRLLDEGHAVGNHTHNHLNGWKTATEDYVANTMEAARLINSSLFRPPYGRIRQQQARGVKAALGARSRIIMWDVLSADFDQSITADGCLQNVLKHVSAGSIVVFHDSEKAFPHLEYVLPKVLAQLRGRYRLLPLT